MDGLADTTNPYLKYNFDELYFCVFNISNWLTHPINASVSY